MELRNPFSLPLHQLGLELVMIVCFTLTLQHAISKKRLFDWLVALFYGVFMELIAFTWLDNYTHAKFTVQLYHDKLPLYVTLLYVVFHYTGLRIAEGLRASFLTESLLAGFAICLLDVPFDIVGASVKWWVWSDKDPNLAARWLGVPVTSYYWYLVFGAVMAALCRLMRKKQILVLAPLIAAATIVVGTLLFLPFHGLHWLGVPHAAIVATHLAGCMILALYSGGGLPDRQIIACAALLFTWHAGLLAATYRTPGKLLSAGAAGLALLATMRRRSSPGAYDQHPASK